MSPRNSKMSIAVTTRSLLLLVLVSILGIPSFVHAELTTPSSHSDLLAEFEYPADYMRREPVLHRAISKTFYTETTVKFAKSSLFKKKAELSNYYHVQLTQEELEAEVSNQSTAETSQQATVQKKSLLNLKPVHY